VRRRHFLMTISTALVPFRARAAEIPTLVYVLVDASLTIPDLKEFRKAWKLLMSRAGGGDRMVVGVVGGHVDKRENSTITEIGDRDLPIKGWNDNPLTYADDLAKAKDLLSSDFESALTAARPDRTELLRSVRGTSRYLTAEKARKKILVILSDMLEDSAEYRFDKISLSETFTKSVIAKVKAQGLLPNLTKVEVYTQVPGVASPAKADQVERFWIAYLSACGAVISHQTYSTLANYRRN